jgi:hypothetical protein
MNYNTIQYKISLLHPNKHLVYMGFSVTKKQEVHYKITIYQIHINMQFETNRTLVFIMFMSVKLKM